MTAPGTLYIVDDDKLICAQLADIMADLGFDPVVFHDGPTFLAHFSRQPSRAIVLLDIQMPGMLGTEVMQHLEKQAIRPSVIIMTGNISLQVALECLRLGARDYITKPIDLDLLIYTINRVVEKENILAMNDELSRLLAGHSAEFQRSSTALKRLAVILAGDNLPKDFPQTALEVLRVTHEALGSELSSISLSVNNRQLVYHVPRSGAGPGSSGTVERGLEFVMNSGTGIIHGSPQRLMEGEPPPFTGALSSSVFLPLRRGAKCFGALQVSRSIGGKPFSESELELLELLCSEIAVLHASAELYENYEKMTIGAITALANAVNHKDGNTGAHARRTEALLRRMVERLGLTEQERDIILFAMRLHDIGKIRVPSSILNKPGPLTDEEWEVMRQHPVWGSEILEAEGLLREIARLVRHHHERYDGKGYPDGLEGKNIPLGSRVLALVDAYDAMRSNRPYRKAMPFARVIEEIRSNLGVQFDPEIGELFLEAIAHGTQDFYSAEQAAASPN